MGIPLSCGVAGGVATSSPTIRWRRICVSVCGAQVLRIALRIIATMFEAVIMSLGIPPSASSSLFGPALARPWVYGVGMPSSHAVGQLSCGTLLSTESGRLRLLNGRDVQVVGETTVWWTLFTTLEGVSSWKGKGPRCQLHITPK